MILPRYGGIMASWVLDRSIGKLIEQYLSVRPMIDRSEVGTIGDPEHAARVSAHNPQDTADSQDGNDPDNQVDAADFPHDPKRGSDMAVFTEELRTSRDSRLWLVIFNGQQFSSYARDGYAPFTWRPYSGSNQHTRHAHVEVNDYHNDVTTPWKVDMATLTAEEHNDLVALASRVLALILLDESKVNSRVVPGGHLADVPLIDLLKSLPERLDRIEAQVGQVEPADPAAIAELLKPILFELVKDAVKQALREGVGQA